MRECRFFPWCSYIEEHGRTKDSCMHYQPMPDVDALLETAESIESYAELMIQCGVKTVPDVLFDYARRIREALGVTADANA